jgi:hypothetical protein
VTISTPKLSDEEKREKRNAYQREWYKNNPDKNRSYRRKSRFGITSQEWDAMFDSQGRCCAICSSDDPANKRGWHTDHDHATGAVRGVLCERCNHLLGHARDNQIILEKAIQYLS